jgi:hypothetical protein
MPPMNKFIRIFSITIISLFTLSVFGWMASHITRGDKKFGFLTGPVKFIYSFPDLFSQSVEEAKTLALPKTFIPTPGHFKPVNELDTDFVVLTTYSDTSDSRSIMLLNLKNDSILYKWTVANPFREHDRILNPLLLPERSLVYSFDGFSGPRRIDSLGNLIWKQDSILAHHSMNMDGNGDIWICSWEPVFDATGQYRLNGRDVFFKDEYITRIDTATGRILFHQSMSGILSANNLSRYLLKSSAIKDPMHINDIQPALRTTKYYQKGDLFISARNPSIILHYRPSTGKVVNLIEGPFVSQHDVDIYGDSSLVLFNNSYYTVETRDSKPPPRDSSRLVFAGDFYSNIVRYNLGSGKFTFIGDSLFRANKIFSYTEGLVEFTGPSTYLVEEQNSGVIWIISDNRVLYKNVLPSQHAGFHHLPNWMRVINND